MIVLITGTSIGQTPQQKTQPVAPRATDMSPEKGSSTAPDDAGPLNSFEEEMLAKRAIKLAEKEHQENLDRAREMNQISREIQDSLKIKTQVDREAVKRLDRLEKLTKKIRGEAGGDDGGETKLPAPPTDARSAMTQIAQIAESLSKDVQNTPRQVVSASVIDTSNVLLELIRVVHTLSR